MARQNIDFTTSALNPPNAPADDGLDTGTKTATAVRPINDGEPAQGAVFKRPSENLRTRTEVIRDELEDLKFLSDADKAMLLTSTGDITWNGLPAGTFTATQNLVLKPFLAPNTSTASRLIICANTQAQVTIRSKQNGLSGQPRAYSGANNITVDFQPVVVGTGAIIVTTTGDGNRVHVQYDSHAVSGTTAGLNSLNGFIQQFNASSVAIALGLEAVAEGTGTPTEVGFPTPPSFIAASMLDLYITGPEKATRYMSGAAEAEKHILTPGNITSFFAADGGTLNKFVEGDVLCVWYDKLVDLAYGGRRQSLSEPPENSSTIPSGSLFMLRRFPARLPGALPVATVVNGQLIFISGRVFNTGETGPLVSSGASYQGSSPNAWADSPTSYIAAGTFESAVDTIITVLGNYATATSGGKRVGNYPAGNIAATNVQDALNELDSEKAGLALANSFTRNNTFTSTVLNTSPITATGNGTAVGINATGGSNSGYGISGWGGGPDGWGGYFRGTGAGIGLQATGGASGAHGVEGQGTAGFAGVSGTGGPSAGAGVSGYGDGGGVGVYGAGQGSGHGVEGKGGSGSGAYGVHGIAFVNNGTAIRGEGDASVSNATGIRGDGKGSKSGGLFYGGSLDSPGVITTGGGDGSGIQATAAGTGGGHGVVAYGSMSPGPDTGVGVYGEARNGNNSGLFGRGFGTGSGVTAVSGTGAFASGVVGTTKGAGGAGVYGGVDATITDGTGVSGAGRGQNAGIHGVGGNSVVGNNNGGQGVYGKGGTPAGFGISGAGVYGEAASSAAGSGGVVGEGLDASPGGFFKGGSTTYGSLGAISEYTDTAPAIWGQVQSINNGHGVVGNGTDSNAGSAMQSCGGYFTARGGNNSGVYGLARGNQAGVKGQGQTTGTADGPGVWGIGGATNGVGGRFWGTNAGVGVECVAGSGAGLYIQNNGNQWDLINTNGDLWIGNGTYKLKMAIALGGGGAGFAGIHATSALVLSAGASTNGFQVGALVNDSIYTLNLGEGLLGVEADARATPRIKARAAASATALFTLIREWSTQTATGKHREYITASGDHYFTTNAKLNDNSGNWIHDVAARAIWTNYTNGGITTYISYVGTAGGAVNWLFYPAQISPLTVDGTNYSAGFAAPLLEAYSTTGPSSTSVVIGSTNIIQARGRILSYGDNSTASWVDGQAHNIASVAASGNGIRVNFTDDLAGFSSGAVFVKMNAQYAGGRGDNYIKIVNTASNYYFTMYVVNSAGTETNVFAGGGVREYYVLAFGA